MNITSLFIFLALQLLNSQTDGFGCFNLINLRYSFRHPYTELQSSSHGQTEAENEAERLRKQAAKIREQVAKLEGKSISQVQAEAAKEKEMISQRNSETKKNHTSSKNSRRKLPIVYAPQTIGEQTRQAALAIERAFNDGITRQTVRLALVPSDSAIGPEDEEWPGGAKQMFREAGKPLTESLLSEIRATAKSLQTDEERKNGKGGFPPQITTQDIWKFDGSAVITAEAASGPSSDVQALVFPNTDTKYLDDITKIDGYLGKERLFLLVNPFWRNVESWGFNILAPKGKQRAQGIVFGCEGGGFQETYVVSRFSVRGEDCVAVKSYPHAWELFAYIEDYSYGGPIQTTIRLGSSEDEPNSKIFTELLNQREEFKLNKTMRLLKNRR